MPPRFAYWTILIDDKPTAFRAREREELLPTFVQLQRKNTNITMQWFARGRLWASREAERDDFQMRKHAAAAPRDRRADRPGGAERRGSDWRPGGAHKDPRDRFKKKNRPERAWSEKDPATQRDRDKLGPPRGDRPWQAKPAGGAPPSDRPWQTKPTGPRAQRKPWSPRPAGGAPRGDRPWQDKRPRAASAFFGSPKRDERQGGRPAGDRPWQGKPRGRPQGDRPWSNRPPGGAPRADGNREARRRSSGPGAGEGGWQNKPSGGDRKPFRPRTGPPQNGPRKKRDDEPPDRG